MSQAAAALRLYALSDLILSEKLGDRFRPSVSAQRDVLPYATYQSISSSPDEALDGDMLHQNDRLQFDIFATSHDDAHAIARRLRGVMMDAYGRLAFDGTLARVIIDGIGTAGGIRDMPADSPVDGSDNWQYHASFDLFVSFTPAT